MEEKDIDAFFLLWPNSREEEEEEIGGETEGIGQKAGWVGDAVSRRNFSSKFKQELGRNKVEIWGSTQEDKRRFVSSEMRT